MPALRREASLLRGLVRVAWILPKMEYCRRFLGPKAVAPLARQLARTRPRLGDQERQNLRRAIALFDRLLGANCYRRVLLEVALDPAAAEQPVFFGLMSNGGKRSGHAWLGSDPSLEARYDAVFSA